MTEPPCFERHYPVGTIESICEIAAEAAQHIDRRYHSRCCIYWSGPARCDCRKDTIAAELMDAVRRLRPTLGGCLRHGTRFDEDGRCEDCR